MESSNTPDVAGRMDVSWDLREVHLGELGETAEARQLVDGLLARVSAPGHDLIVAGFSNQI